MSMEIGGEDYEVSPAVWDVFDDWYGDKAYRKADFVARFEAAVRAQVAADIAAHASARSSVRKTCMSIALTHADAARIALGGAHGEPSEG